MGIDHAQTLASLCVRGIDLQDFLVERAGAPGELHIFVELPELEIGGRAERVEFDGLLKLFDRLFAILFDGRQAARQHGAIARHMRRDSYAFSQPENRAGKIVRAKEFDGALGAFLLFRIADVVKPFPAGRLERLPGGIGVMADDAMAAGYANLVLRVIMFGIARFSR